MNWHNAVLLGILEGLTEFLPVSSTGHLILLGDHLGANDEASKTLDVVIQLGAVLAVAVYFRARLAKLLRGLLAGEPEQIALAKAVLIAFIPAAALGLLFHKKIEEALFAPRPVAAALIVGGVVMIAIELQRKRAGNPGEDGLAAVTPNRAFGVGLAQCISLWPGSSRSMTTIVGAQLGGLSTAAAADFSFLLAIPTLGAATVYKLLKGGRALFAIPGGASSLAVGLVVSFVVALIVIAAFLRYLKRFGLLPFGVYRIVLGVIVLATLGAAAAPVKAADGAARPAVSAVAE
uniref:Undecaprenyl-diphosphatase n=1 Tax=Aetherobacter fasciculatus TaxID=888830 RepID=A0A3S7UUU8_9BACT|nr:undecaprenyl-diphosphatase [Aetherobacter fasciculatus]